MTARPWYADQDPRIVGVILLAEYRNLMSGDEHDLILSTWGPAYAESVRQIATDLAWIERLTHDAPVDVLYAYDGPGAPRHLYPVDDADALRARLQADVISNAQWIASLLKLRGAA